MSTEFEVNGQMVAHRTGRGRGNRCRCQMEMTEAEWNAMDHSQTVCEGSWGNQNMDEWMAEMQATCDVVWMNRFEMNRRARAMQEVAARWAGSHPDVAHTAAAMAQTARNWRG